MKFRAKAILCLIAIVAIIALALLGPFVIRFSVAICVRFFEQMDIAKGTALLVAACALLVAWNNFRRGNTAVIKLVSIETLYTHSVDRGRYHSFNVYFKNLGIPLRNPSVTVNGTAGSWWSFLLTRYKDETAINADGDSSLEKRMVAHYALVSTSLKAADIDCLKFLIEPEATNLSITIRSDGFLVKRFYLRNRKHFRAWKNWWNELGLALSDEFTQVKLYKGRTLHHRRTILPRLQDHWFSFAHFVQAASRGNE